jgi:hypothetical protein
MFKYGISFVIAFIVFIILNLFIPDQVTVGRLIINVFAGSTEGFMKTPQGQATFSFIKWSGSVALLLLWLGGFVALWKNIHRFFFPEQDYRY